MEPFPTFCMHVSPTCIPTFLGRGEGGGGGCCPHLADSISEVSALSSDSISGGRVLCCPLSTLH